MTDRTVPPLEDAVAGLREAIVALQHRRAIHPSRAKDIRVVLGALQAAESELARLRGELEAARETAPVTEEMIAE